MFLSQSVQPIAKAVLRKKILGNRRSVGVSCLLKLRRIFSEFPLILMRNSTWPPALPSRRMKLKLASLDLRRKARAEAGLLEERGPWLRDVECFFQPLRCASGLRIIGSTRFLRSTNR